MSVSKYTWEKMNSLGICLEIKTVSTKNLLPHIIIRLPKVGSLLIGFHEQGLRKGKRDPFSIYMAINIQNRLKSTLGRVVQVQICNHCFNLDVCASSLPCPSNVNLEMVSKPDLHLLHQWGRRHLWPHSVKSTHFCKQDDASSMLLFI